MTEWAARRFWTEATAVEADEGHAVVLDGRPLRTPARVPLVLPSRLLAEAVAREWQDQPETIDPRAMPLTRAANSAIDRVAPARAAVIAMLADYGETDLLCYRAEAPATLAERQGAAWDPMLDWAAEALGARLVCGAGVMHVAQPEGSLRALRAAIEPLDAFELTGLNDLVTLSGSLILGLAVARGADAPQRLWELSRIDETWQAEQWGEDAEAAAAAEDRRRSFLRAARFVALARGQQAPLDF
ncbi:MAG: ATP12 family chaperone protein [Rhodosalinus sp.]|uniref:ATP12 family chaperone protein n=1 Tax=Rhodosalinus sp. TaxID=2047741 RepID=UPI00397D80CA